MTIFCLKRNFDQMQLGYCTFAFFKADPAAVSSTPHCGVLYQGSYLISNMGVSVSHYACCVKLFTLEHSVTALVFILVCGKIACQ